MVEGVGFEPTDGFPSLVFKTSALNHSATLPALWQTPREIQEGQPPRNCSRMETAEPTPFGPGGWGREPGWFQKSCHGTEMIECFAMGARFQ